MEPLGEELRAELRRAGIPETSAASLDTAWPEAVGEEIARNAWPARLQADGTLVVHVSDSTWGYQLTLLAPEISPRLPGSPRLKFVPGPLPAAAATDASSATPEPPEATLEETREAAEWTAGIADDELREAVARAARASLARAAAKVAEETAADRPF